jgi:hypothetical protein
MNGPRENARPGYAAYVGYVTAIVMLAVCDATISAMGDCDAAQAVQLIRALCDQLREMTHQLAGVESRDVMR